MTGEQQTIGNCFIPSLSQVEDELDEIYLIQSRDDRSVYDCFRCVVDGDDFVLEKSVADVRFESFDSFDHQNKVKAKIKNGSEIGLN